MVTNLAAFALALLVAPQARTNPSPPNPVPLGRPPSSRPHEAPPSNDRGTTSGGSGGSTRFSPPRTTNVQVNSASTADQDEVPLRVDPNDRLHLISGANDNRTGPYNCAFYASFDGPARAIRCGLEIAERVHDLGLEIRAGLHTGECERVDGKLGGLAVTIGARVASRAGASEVLVSQTVKDLVAGSGLRFADRGPRALKGVPGEWRLHAVEDGRAP